MTNLVTFQAIEEGDSKTFIGNTTSKNFNYNIMGFIINFW